MDPDGFRSRALSADLVARADLVLTASRAERATCVTLAPAAVGRVFTMRQFGRLAAGLDPAVLGGLGAEERIRALPAEIRRARGGYQPVPADEDDLADPVNGPPPGFHACAREIQRLLDAALRLIVTT